MDCRRSASVLSVAMPPSSQSSASDDETDQKCVCFACTGEAYLSDLIHTAGTEQTCSYCGETQEAVGIEQLADHIEGAFNRHYQQTSTEPNDYEFILQRDRESSYEWERHPALVTPGIVRDVPQSARLWQEEIFGPIALVKPFGTVDEAPALTNDSSFGLQGSVFTRDIGTAFRFADDFDVGALWINEASRFRLDLYPFGGVKQSGVGREGVRYSIEEMSQLRFVGIWT